MDAVPPEEVEILIQSLRKSSVATVGDKHWLENHEAIQRLSLQAVIEASACREEMVKELMALHGKVELLVHEAFCIVVWRAKILPHLLEANAANQKATFFLYTVLYHEAASITFLETLLFHQSCCESLGDSAIDLLDYCAQAITQLIGITNKRNDQGNDSKEESGNVDDTAQHQKELAFQIGIKSLTILSYLVDRFDSLPLSVKSRMVSVHDVPCLISTILGCRPWLRRTDIGFEKYIEGKWQSNYSEKLTKTEVHVWLILRQLLFDPTAMEHYQINNFRQRELGRLSGLLNETVLDQVGCLNELKHMLCSMQVTDPTGSGKSKPGFVLEELPQMKERILAEARREGWEKIKKGHVQRFVDLDQEELVQLAQRLNATYNNDFLLHAEEFNEKRCVNCRKVAEKKCARCKQVYYCSRECQRENWPSHKSKCK